MAIANFLKKNTYSVINSTSIDKQLKTIGFEIICYEDNTKTEVLLKKQFELSFDKQCEIINNIYYDEINIKKDNEEIFLLTNDKQGLYIKINQEFIQDGKLVLKSFFNLVRIPEIIFIEKENKYMRFKNNKYEDYDGFDNSHYWENNFDLLENSFKLSYNACKKLKLFNTTAIKDV